MLQSHQSILVVAVRWRHHVNVLLPLPPFPFAFNCCSTAPSWVDSRRISWTKNTSVRRAMKALWHYDTILGWRMQISSWVWRNRAEHLQPHTTLSNSRLKKKTMFTQLLYVTKYKIVSLREREFHYTRFGGVSLAFSQSGTFTTCLDVKLVTRKWVVWKYAERSPDLGEYLTGSQFFHLQFTLLC